MREAKEIQVRLAELLPSTSTSKKYFTCKTFPWPWKISHFKLSFTKMPVSLYILCKLKMGWTDTGKMKYLATHVDTTEPDSSETICNFYFSVCFKVPAKTCVGHAQSSGAPRYGSSTSHNSLHKLHSTTFMVRQFSSQFIGCPRITFLWHLENFFSASCLNSFTARLYSFVLVQTSFPDVYLLFWSANIAQHFQTLLQQRL